MYRINPYLEEQNQCRFHAGECHYIGQLEARCGLIRLDNVDVDAEQLVRRPFRCDTRWCLRAAGRNGTRKWSGSCCTDLEVSLTAEEIERLTALGQAGVERLGTAARDPLAAAARRMAGGEFTERTETGETALAHRGGGCCALGWITRGGELRCAINALCRELGRPLGHYKPDPCYLFPLHPVEYRPGRYFVTVICGASHKAMGADGFVARLRCVRRPAPDAPPAYVALRDELVHCFGADFYRALAAAAAGYMGGVEGERKGNRGK